MGDVIELKGKQVVEEPAYIESQEMFWVLIEQKGGSIARLGFLKNLETGQIGFGIIENYIEVDSDSAIYETVLELCEDDDDFVFDKIMRLWDE